MILLTVPAYRPRLGRFDELPAPGTCRGYTRLHGHRVTNGPCCHGQMQMPRSETELPHALSSHTCRERCCIGHRERMGNGHRGHMGLDSPITIRGRPLLESPGHRAGGAAGHQHGWSNKGVFPIDFALEGPSIGSRTALGPHLRRSCAPLRRPRGGRLERQARLECMLRRRVRTAEPCLLRKSHAARDAVTCKCRAGCLPDQSFLTSPAP